ncbi:MAG TPA: hypothetical protein GX701_06900, partial [Clostridiales bacterium]|nr:hypothetical protein [Clostridiales bacterium]
PATEPPATEEPPATTAPETEEITDTQPPLEPPETEPVTEPPATEDGGVIIVDPETPLDPLPETGVKENRLGNLLLSLFVAVLISVAAAIDLGRTKKSKE